MAAYGNSLPLPATLPFTLGQGSYPVASVWYTTYAASDTDPLWVDVTGKVRAFSTSRGRENELGDIDAGTATITLDNRDRTFDPVANPLIRPMNRWKIKEEFSGESQHIFVGYAESYDQSWPGQVDQVTQVRLVDEFKVLALDRLPTMSPPRDSYQDLLMFDNPAAYWTLDGDASLWAWPNAVAGTALVPRSGGVDGDGNITSGSSPIPGDPGTFIQVNAGTRLRTTAPPNGGEDGDGAGAGVGISLWFKYTGLEGATRQILTGPNVASGNLSYHLQLLTSGAIRGQARQEDGTVRTADSSPLTAGTWYHLALLVGNGLALTLYVNGAAVDSDPFTTIGNPLDAGGNFFYLGDEALTNSMGFDHVVIYRGPFDATRVQAHYTAGSARGFDSQLPGTRVGAVLDVSESVAARSVQAGTNTMTDRFMVGQPPLDELKQAVKAESVDSILFTARDGTVTYLADGHRSSSPYNTVQATFDDDGTDLPYTGIEIDYSESFLANEWNVTPTGQNTQTASDATSVDRYFKRSQSLTDLPITSAADAAAIAAAMLAKYKDPFQRITGLLLKTNDPDLAETIFRLDIGDRIRVFRTPEGGGSRIDQTLFIQKIEVSSTARSPVWEVRLSVSPL